MENTNEKQKIYIITIANEDLDDPTWMNVQVIFISKKEIPKIFVDHLCCTKPKCHHHQHFELDENLHVLIFQDMIHPDFEDYALTCSTRETVFQKRIGILHENIKSKFNPLQYDLIFNRNNPSFDTIHDV